MKTTHLFFLAAMCSAALVSNTQAKGVVDVIMDGGSLGIVGDDDANSVSLREVSSNQWEIVGSSGTKLMTLVDGQFTFVKSLVTPPVTGGITILMLGGNDTVSIRNGNIDGSLIVHMDEGDDTTTLSSLTIDTFLAYRGGDGKDSLVVRDVAVNDVKQIFASILDAGNGNDAVNVDRLVDHAARITLGEGNDRLSLARFSPTESVFPWLDIQAEGGDDRVNLSSVETGALTVFMGEGNDALGLFGTRTTSASADGGDGSDFLLSLQSPGVENIDFEFKLQF